MDKTMIFTGFSWCINECRGIRDIQGSFSMILTLYEENDNNWLTKFSPVLSFTILLRLYFLDFFHAEVHLSSICPSCFSTDLSVPLDIT